MKKLLALGLAVLMLVSVAVCLPVTAVAEEVAAPTFVYDFSAYKAADDYGFVDLADLTVEGGTEGYYTFTATEDGASAGTLDPGAYLAAPADPAVALSEMAAAVLLYRTEASTTGEMFVNRSDAVSMGQPGSHVCWQYEADDEWHLALVDASYIWGDTEDVTASLFRFDPLVVCEEGDSVDVSYIKFFATVEDAEAYVAANSECIGEVSTTENVVNVDGIMYGYTDKIEVTYSDKTLRTEALDYEMSLATASKNKNMDFLMKEGAEMVGGRIINWVAGGYAHANHTLYALYGRENNYVKFDSLPFADYDRVTVILASSGEVDGPWRVGFISDVEKLLSEDSSVPVEREETDFIVYGECVSPKSEEGVYVNLSGLGTGLSWNTAERAVVMNIEGCTWDAPAALYVGAYDGHIALVAKMVFEREVEADLYVDEYGDEYVSGEDVIAEEGGVYYAYTGLFEVEAIENDEGVVEYWYDPRVYVANAPEAPEPPTHTITFIADGKVVATYTFTEGSTVVDWTAPEVPAKEGFTGTWHAYVLGGTSDLEVRARYSLASVPGVDEDTTTQKPAESESVVVDDVTTTLEEDTTAAVEETTATVADVEGEQTKAPETESTEAPEAAGCKCVIASASILAVVAMAGVVVCKKKD